MVKLSLYDIATVGSLGGGDAVRGVFMYGNTASYTYLNVIDYININTTGNATDFGDASDTRGYTNACFHSDVRACHGGGIGSPYYRTTIDYITIATTGNATDFGDLTVARYSACGANSSTRGIVIGGNDDSARNVMDYVTIASTGNATDFGDSFLGYPKSCCNNTTRAVSVSANGNQMEYITMATTGNATDFGNISVNVGGHGAGMNTNDVASQRGVFALGYKETAPAGLVNTMEYITIDTTGNSTDFGDLTQAKNGITGANASPRAVIAGGNIGGGVAVNVIEYIDISVTGNATDFGDLTVTRQHTAGGNEGY